MITEWLESSVAEYFRELLKANIENSENEQAECYIETDPNLTHVFRARMIGQSQAFSLVLDAFEQSDLDILETEGEEDEPIGNLSDGGQSTH